MRRARLHIVPLLALLAGAAAVHAQPAATEARASRSLTAGPYIAFGPSLHLAAPHLETVGSVLAFRIGGSAWFPITSMVGGTLDIGCDSRGIKRGTAGNENNFTTTRVGYFTFMPGVSISAFWAGLNLGVPIAASQTHTIGSSHSSESLSSEEFDKLEYMVEPRIGATVRIFDNERGWLGVVLSMGITLNEISLGGDVTPQQSLVAGNYQMFTGHVGLTYQFALPE